MQKMTRNFVSISFALALCVGIVGMAFAQEAEEPAANTWGVPSTTNGAFSIGVQTVYDGFLVTTPVKKYDATTGKWEEQDTTINENDGDDTDYLAKISINAGYDNSDAPGVGYSFGVEAGLYRAVNNDGEGEPYFSNPWGKAFFFDKQLWLRTGSLESPWNAWANTWTQGGFDGGVELNFNPSFLGGGLNLGVSLPILVKEKKADYPFKNLVVGFKLGEVIPYTTLSANLTLKEAGPTGTENDPVSSMNLSTELRVSLSPIEFYFEMLYSDFDQDSDKLKLISLDDRSAQLQMHPYLEFSLAKLADLGAFSLASINIGAWIKSDPFYASDGNSNTAFSLEWTPSYKLSDAITAALFFGGYFDVWGGDATKEKAALETAKAYNQVGFTLRPALTFSIAPNAQIRVRDAIYFAQVGVDPDAGIKNQVQVRFFWSF
jgi:hypothetical protein